jgi:hypothetical protein
VSQGKSTEGRHLQKFKAALTSVMVVAITLVLVGAIPTGSVKIERPDQWFVFLIAGALALVLLGARLWVSEAHHPISAELPKEKARHPQLRPAVARDIDPTTEFLASAKHLFALRFPVASIGRLVAIACDPGLHVARISEEVSFTLDTVTQTVTRTVIVDDPQAPLLVPVMRVPKGHLIDQLRVTANGTTVSTLTYVEYQGAMVTSLESLFKQAVPRSSSHSSRFLVEALLACCSNNAVQSRARRRLRRQMKATLAPRPTNPGASPSVEVREEDTRAFQELVNYLLESYFVIAVVEPAHLTARTKVTVEHTRRRYDTLGGWRNHLRGLIGLGSRTYFLDLPHATEARSYHFRTNVPEGSYLFRSVARPEAVGVEMNDPSHARPTDLHLNGLATGKVAAMPRLHVSEALGLDYVHVYGRDLAGRLHKISGDRRRSEGRLLVRFYAEYRERPPGMLAMLLPVSLYLAILSWGVGRYFSVVFAATTSRAPPTSSWPAIIFGVPALVSGWLLSRLRRETLQICSLTTLWALLWLVVNAGWAVGLALLSVTKPDVGTVHPFPFLWIHNGAWTALMLSTGSNFVLLAHMWISRTSRYWRRFQLRLT